MSPRGLALIRRDTALEVARLAVGLEAGVLAVMALALAVLHGIGLVLILTGLAALQGPPWLGRTAFAVHLGLDVLMLLAALVLTALARRAADRPTPERLRVVAGIAAVVPLAAVALQLLLCQVLLVPAWLPVAVLGMLAALATWRAAELSVPPPEGEAA